MRDIQLFYEETPIKQPTRFGLPIRKRNRLTPGKFRSIMHELEKELAKKQALQK